VSENSGSVALPKLSPFTAFLKLWANPVDQRTSGHYRPDIDGLRSVAVLPVVIYHLGFYTLRGGFVGVDVFFVISGYLIGGIILGQIRNGTYSIANFYVRRIRRLAPALVAVLVATTAAVLLLSMPAATVDYGKSLISSVAFLSNFYFWESINYFGPQAEMKPLVHTWSLAVEEQYYIVFPLLMLGMRRLAPRAIDLTLWALILGSLALSAWLLPTHPSATFYLLPTRLWELLLGVVAVEAPVRLMKSRLVRELASWAGLGLIAAAMVFYSPQTPFPGLAAVAPCLGAALLLMSGAAGTSSISRLLAIRPMVFIGLISYSLYLWHWPVIVLLKQGLPADRLSIAVRLGALVGSIVLAWLTWLLIERPWRNPSVSNRALVAWGAVAGAALALAGLGLVVTAGLPQRLAPEARRFAAFSDDATRNDFRDGRCFFTPRDSFADFDRGVCLQRSATRPNVLLIGDSLSAHLWSGLKARQPTLNILQATAAGCKPVLTTGTEDAATCTRMKRFILDDYLKGHPVDWVIVSASWEPWEAKDAAAMIDELKRRGYGVVLAGPIVRYKASLPILMALSVQRHDPGLVDRLRRADGAALDAAFREVARAHGAIYWSPYAALCPAGRCRTTDDKGDPIQFDYAHLTAAGSAIVADAFPVGQLK
jgi:peptidoglycan/LPS O-acetylase OafA/YrhL